MQTFQPGFIKDVRKRIAEVLAAYSANDVPSICRRYGLADGEIPEAFSGKFRYASKRLLELSNDRIVEVAKEVAQEEGDDDLVRLLRTIEPADKIAVSPGLRNPKRAYYAERAGKVPDGGRLDLIGLKSLFVTEYERWEGDGYFQQYFGFSCVDEGYVNGLLGGNVGSVVLLSLFKSNIWPVVHSIHNYDEDDIFSMIEFLFDHISKPLTGQFHSYSNCGMHWETFSGSQGQLEYRASMNTLLGRYRQGFELSKEGQVMELGPDGTSNLLATELPVSDNNVKGRVGSAIAKFRNRSSSPEDRRDAVRDLADVLEYLRPKLREVLNKKDEADLFNIANQFGIRHHNSTQKTDYDQAIWLSWMFYFYLATIHACVRLIDKAKPHS